MEILRGLLGLIILIGIAFLFSKHKKKVNWKLVLAGVSIQLVLGLLIFSEVEIPFTEISLSDIFSYLANFFTQLLSFTDIGAEFIFGNLVTSNPEISKTMGYIFAFKVLPTVVFFSALTSLLYYLGILQKVVYGFAWILSKTMRLSGAESLAAAANIFVGQTEAPLVVKPYISKMSKSEILCLMTGGMATIAGGVFAAFIGFLGGDDIASQQEFAKHLLTASILSAPAAIVCAKILFPETDEVDTELNLSKEQMGNGPLEAIANGTTDGIKLAVNVAGMILVFLAFIAMINYLLVNMVGAFDGIGSWHFQSLNEKIATNTIYDNFNLEMILGYLFAPLAWVIGINSEDIEVIYNGHEHILTGELKTIHDQAYFLYVGSLHSRKNILHTLKSFDEYKNQYGTDKQLLIVGREMFSDKESELFYSSMKHRQDVIFTGYVSDAELACYYHHADALINLSYFEGFGIPLLEAFSHGIPVIASNCSCYPEIASDSALLADPEDIESIAKNMHLITSDLELRKELIEKGLKNKERFSWNNSAEKIMNTILKYGT